MRNFILILILITALYSLATSARPDDVDTVDMLRQMNDLL